MKYLVVVPVIGYGEYTVEAEDDLEISEIKQMVQDGELDLVPEGKDPLKEYILVTRLNHAELPDEWPSAFEVTPY